MNEELNISVSALKSLQQQRRAVLRIIAAFRRWKEKPKFRWSGIFQKDSKDERKSPRMGSVKKSKVISTRSLQLASESYQFMMDNSDLGDIVIVEQC